MDAGGLLWELCVACPDLKTGEVLDGGMPAEWGNAGPKNGMLAGGRGATLCLHRYLSKRRVARLGWRVPHFHLYGAPAKDVE
jgi:hypothetical protein